MLTFDIQSTQDKAKAQDTPQLLYLLMTVHPPRQFMASQLPLNLCLVIDRSTSMRGDRLDKVKSGAALLVEKLSTEDVLSIISFSDRAEVVLPASRVRNKTPVLSRIRNINASGGTEIYQGLHAGLKEMRKADLSKHINHIILLTDGHTYGDEAACLLLAQQAAESRVGISGFGLGAEWNDLFLDRLVSPSGGHSMYVETPAQIVQELQQRIQSLGSVYAQNLRLMTNQFPAGIRLQYGLKFRPFAQPLPDNKGELMLGNVEGRSPLVFLLELIAEGLSTSTKLNLPLSFHADIPSERLINHPFNLQFPLNIVSEEIPITPHPQIVEAIRVLNMYRMNEKAWQEVEAGQIDLATTRMRRLTTRLLESGHTQLAHQAQLETERLSTIGTLSLDGRKKLKYGTRALLTKTLTLNPSDPDSKPTPN